MSAKPKQNTEPQGSDRGFGEEVRADSTDPKTVLEARYASVLSEPVPPRIRALIERLKIVERNA